MRKVANASVCAPAAYWRRSNAPPRAHRAPARVTIGVDAAKMPCGILRRGAALSRLRARPFMRGIPRPRGIGCASPPWFGAPSYCKGKQAPKAPLQSLCAFPFALASPAGTAPAAIPWGPCYRAGAPSGRGSPRGARLFGGFAPPAFIGPRLKGAGLRWP